MTQLTGIGFDFCISYSNGPIDGSANDVWTSPQVWLPNSMSYLELLSWWKINYGFNNSKAGFCFASSVPTTGPSTGLYAQSVLGVPSGSGYTTDYTKMDTLCIYMNIIGVKMIACNQNNADSNGYDSVTAHAATSNFIADWSAFATHYHTGTTYGDTFSAFNIFGEPRDYTLLYFASPLAELQRWTDCIAAIHAIDPDRICIFPFPYYYHWTPTSFHSDLLLTSIGGHTILDEPNVVFDVLHPYWFPAICNVNPLGYTTKASCNAAGNFWLADDNSYGDPVSAANGYVNDFLNPSIAFLGSNRCWLGETFMWDPPDVNQQTWLTTIIQDMMSAGVGFALWNQLTHYSSALVNAINASGYNSSLLTPTISAPTLSNNSIYIGSSITGSITISGTGATPTGTVTFQESNDGISWTQIGVAKILSSGTATSDSFQPFYGGTFLIKVNYSGDLVYNAVVSSASTLTVSGGGSNLITDTIGSPANESSGWNNYIYSSNITASGNGLLHSIGIFVNGPIGNARVALYSSSAGGVLSGLLAQSASTAITVANTFQDIACTGSTLVAGHTYYIAFQLDNALTGLWCQVKGTLNYAPYSYGSFPDPTGTYSPEIFSINMRMTYGSLIPTFVLSLSQISISLGQSITASITVSGTGTTPTGFITFQESNDNGQTWIQLGTVKSLIGGSATSDSFTPGYSQTYLIKAIYSGDNYYAPGTSGTLVLAVSQFTYTVSIPYLSALFVLAGTTVNIMGAVSGSSTAPTGTVNLMISADNGNSWIQYGSTKTLTAGSHISTATFDNYNSPNIGTFWFMIDYNGDSNYTWSSGPADALVVTGSHSTTQKTLIVLAATI